MHYLRKIARHLRQRQYEIAIAIGCLMIAAASSRDYLQRVPSVDALSSYSSSYATLLGEVSVAGYYGPGTPGGGEFIYSSTCNGGHLPDGGAYVGTPGAGGCWVRQFQVPGQAQIAQWGCRTRAQNGNRPYDCSSAFAAALRYLDRDHGGPGGTLLLPPGPSWITTKSSIKMVSGVAISGFGPVNTNVNMPNWTSRWNWRGKGAAITSAGRIQNARLSHFALNGASSRRTGGAGQIGIDWACMRCEISNIGISRIGKQAVIFERGSGASFIHDNLLSGMVDYNRARGAPRRRMGVVELSGSDSFIYNNEISGAGRGASGPSDANGYVTGLYVKAGGAAFIHDNVFEYLDTCAVIENANRFRDNRCDFVLKDGLVVNGPHNIVAGFLTSVSSRGATGAAIVVRRAGSNTFTDIHVVPGGAGASIPYCVEDMSATPRNTGRQNSYSANTTGGFSPVCRAYWKVPPRGGPNIATLHGTPVPVTCQGARTVTLDLDSNAIKDKGDLSASDRKSCTYTLVGGFPGMDLYFTLGPRSTFAGVTGPTTAHFKRIGSAWVRI